MRPTPRALAFALLPLAFVLGCGGPTCGDRVVQDGEQCDATPDAPCETACGSRGVVRCDPATCRLGPCEPPAEVCNGADDDCDGRADEGFECAAGTTLDCETSCGSAGQARCDAACAVSSCAPPPEVCDNGVDDDCDGIVDRLAFLDPLTLTEAAALSPPPTLARVGGVPVLAWTEPSAASHRAYVASVSPRGELALLAPPIEARSVQDLALVGTGDAALVTFTDVWPPVVVAARVSGGAVTEPTAIHDRGLGSGGAPALAVSERTVGAVLRVLSNGVHSIHFASWAAGERPSGTTVRVSGGTHDVASPRVAWDGAGFGIVWSDERHGAVRQEGNEIVGNTELYFARVSEHGALLAPEVRLTETDAFSDRSSLVWNGRAYGLTWSETQGASSRAHFALLRRDGTRIGRARRLEGAAGATLEWSGSEWGLAWLAGRRGREEVVFARLSPEGERLGEPARLPLGPGDRSVLGVLWDGTSWSVLWMDRASLGATVRLARVGCD